MTIYYERPTFEDDAASSLTHHGIKGQKWGVRRFQNPDGSLTAAGRERYAKRSKGSKKFTVPKNTKFLKNYSGPAYFVSENSTVNSLEPRVPNNFFTKNGYEDGETPRVCFAPSIDKCLAGLSQNVEGKSFTVYKPDDVKNYRVFKPNTAAVPDSSITDELWVCQPVKLKKVGSIVITGNKGTKGKTFSYGKTTATLYDDWTYELKKI